MIQINCSIPRNERYNLITQLLNDWRRDIIYGWLPMPTQEELDILSEKGRVFAIKAYRDRTRLGLIDAKYVIDYYFLVQGYRHKQGE